MTRLTTIDTDTLWDGIDEQRARTAGLLEGLTRLVTWWRVERELADSPLAKAS